MHKICAIIVTYNGEKYIEQCLSSLAKCSLDLHTIIVDNNSTDKTTDIITNDFPDVEVIQSKENLGFGKANNMGLIKAYQSGYDYFFLLNQDAWITENSIEELIKTSSKNDSFGIVSPIHLDAEGDHLQGDFEFFMEKDELSNFLSDYKSNTLYEEIYEVDFVNAAAWMITKDALKKVGLFHPLFFHYGEDDNYVNRLHANDLKIGIASKSIIHHDHEVKPFNPLKDNPTKQFRQELLRAYLNPLNKGKEDELKVQMGRRKRWLIKHKSLGRMTAGWIKYRTKFDLYRHEERYKNLIYRHLQND